MQMCTIKNWQCSQRREKQAREFKPGHCKQDRGKTKTRKLNGKISNMSGKVRNTEEIFMQETEIQKNCPVILEMTKQPQREHNQWN